MAHPTRYQFKVASAVQSGAEVCRVTVSMAPSGLFHLSGGRGGWQGCRFVQEPKGKLKKKQFLDLPMAEAPLEHRPRIIPSCTSSLFPRHEEC